MYLAGSSLATTWTAVVQNSVWDGSSSIITLCGQAWGAGNPRLTALWLQIGLVIAISLSFVVQAWYWCVGYILVYCSNDQAVVDAGIRFVSRSRIF